MIINQICVFLENKAGELSRFVSTLAEKGIDLRALSIAEAQDYGVLRIITENPEETEKTLAEAGWAVKHTPVLAVYVPDEPGSLTKILAVLAKNNISLKYTYAFVSRKKGCAVIVLRVGDNEKAAALLASEGIDTDGDLVT